MTFDFRHFEWPNDCEIFDFPRVFTTYPKVSLGTDIAILSLNMNTISGATTYKICTECERSKPNSDFYKKGFRTDSQCKTCVLKRKAVTRKQKLKALSKPAIQVIEHLVMTETLVDKVENSNLYNLLRDLAFKAVIGVR